MILTVFSANFLLQLHLSTHSWMVHGLCSLNSWTFPIGFHFFWLPNRMLSLCSLDVQPVFTLSVENTFSQSVICLYLW